uniref:DNA/RNA-binding domain-containing protein n=1 Tax=Picocystis salinarum TaxID=88271 RepID=A0A7S3UEX9_9CHLO
MEDGDGDVSMRRQAKFASRMAILSGLEGPAKHDGKARRRMRTACVELLLADLSYAETKDVETRLWRRGCNASKDVLRRKMKECLEQDKMEEAEKHRKDMLELLEDARKTYRCLVALLQRVYGDVKAPGGEESGVHVEKDLLEKHEAPEETVRRTCATCLLRLGDLARYEVEIDETNLPEKNWNEAETWYRSATKVWPHAGNAHNQMAVLAVYREQPVVACYHYLRSLAVKELFFTAKDNLALFFGKEAAEHRPNDADNRNEPGKIVHRISHTVLQVLGTLYNHAYPEDGDTVLVALRKDLHNITKKRHCKNIEVLQRMEGGSSTLLKMLTCCISMVYWVRTVKGNDKEDPVALYEKFLSKAMTLCFLFGRCMAQSSLFMLPDDSDILAGLMILLEWMSTCPDGFLSLGCSVNGVSASQDFYDALVKYLGKCKVECTYDRHTVALPEDVELNGFVPLQEIHKALDFNSPSPEGQTLASVRRHRLFQAAKAMASRGGRIPVCVCENGFALRKDDHAQDGQRQERALSVPCCKEAQLLASEATLAKRRRTEGDPAGIKVEHRPVDDETLEFNPPAENRPSKWQRVSLGPRTIVPPVAPLFGAKDDTLDPPEKGPGPTKGPPPPGWLDSYQLASITARTRHFTVPPNWSDPLPEQELKQINPYAFRWSADKEGTT